MFLGPDLDGRDGVVRFNLKPGWRVSIFVPPNHTVVVIRSSKKKGRKLTLNFFNLATRKCSSMGQSEETNCEDALEIFTFWQEFFRNQKLLVPNSPCDLVAFLEREPDFL